MKQPFYPTSYTPKTLLLGIDAPYNRTPSMEAYFEEFDNLAKTNGLDRSNTLFLKLRDIDSAFFLTKGKLEIVLQECEKNEIEHIVISEPLTVQQERNLEDFLGRTISDRTKLILEIFEKAAHSAEGKTQVAIAMLQHRKSRLAGKGIHLSQQAGVVGLRGGPGETLKERERRRIDEQITKLRRQLSRIQTTRETQRKQRLSRGVPHICLVGYTNAGKSTLLNRLTKAEALAEDKLFATLDTTTRELYANGQKRGILSDTVGFIQLLPPQLIAAFKSTLSELEYADLLLHVVDLSDKNWQEHIKVVQKILDEIGVIKETLYVFNKSDTLCPKELQEVASILHDYQPHVITNAHSKEGIKNLSQFLAGWQKK